MCADFFNNLDRLRLSPEQIVKHPDPMPGRTAKPPQIQRIKGEFVRGPIPLVWLTIASRLPGKALALAIAIWFESGRRRRANTIILTTAILDRFNVGRKAKYRALKHLQDAGLIVVHRKPRRNPVVTILEIKDDDNASPSVMMDDATTQNVTTKE